MYVVADNWRPARPSYDQERVLIDASKARENWWASQHRDDIDPRNPHQLRLAPLFLRQQGFLVTVAPPGSTVTAEVLQQHDIVIRTQCISPYTMEELSAYKERVEKGGHCILIGRAHYDDVLAEQFGLQFSKKSQAAEIAMTLDHAMTRSIGTRYGPFCIVEKHPSDFQCLASLTPDATQPVLGSLQFSNGMVLAMGMDAVDDRDERLLSDVVKSLASYQSADGFVSSLQGAHKMAMLQPRLPAIELTSPAMDAELPDRSRHEWTLKWNPVPGIRMAQVLVYAPSRSLSLDFDTLQERGEILLRPARGFQLNDSQRSSWYWQVRLKTEAGEFGRWSQPRSFSIAAVEEFTEPLPPVGSIEGSWLISDSPNAGRGSFAGGERWYMSTSFGRERRGMIWDLATNPPELVIDDLVSSDVRVAPSISSDGRWAFASIGQRGQGQPRLIDLLTKEHPEFLFEHPGNVTSHHFSGNGTWYISRTKESNRLWDLKADDPTSKFETLNEPQNLSQMQPFVFDRSRRWLVAGNRLLDLNDKAPLASSRILPNKNLTPVSFSSDGNWLVAGNCLVDMRAKEPGQDRVFTLPTIESFSNVNFSANQKVLLIGNLYVRLSNDDPSQQVTKLPITGGQFDAFAISKDGRYVTASNAQRLVVWEFQDEATKPSQRSGMGPGGGYISFPMSFHLKLYFSDDSHWLVSTSYDGDATLYDLTKPDLAPKKLTRDGRDYRIIGFTQDHRWLYVGAGNKVDLWDLTNDSVGDPEQAIKLFEGETRWVGMLSKSEDGRWLVCNDRKSMPKLYDLSRESPFQKPVTIDHPNSYGVLSPDGRYFVTRHQSDFGASLPANQPAELRLWSLIGENPGKQYVQVPGHNGDVKTSTFSPGGHWLLIGDARSTRMWDVAHLIKGISNQP
ncbi:WD40 repeat domain-containing protein [Planctomycetaceae bacterium SH139]